MPRSPAKSLTSTAASPPGTSLDPPRDAESVAHHHQHVRRPAVLDFRADPQPVLRALPVAVLPGPQAQHVTLTVHGDAQGELDGPVRDLPLPDLRQ